MTVRAALKAATQRLELHGVPDAAHDAAWLMGSLMGLSRLELLTRGEDVLTAATEAAFQLLLERRAAREPLQYILGETEFMGHRLRCRPPVLIPRNDTEVLCLQALRLLKPGQRALDLCCGSGAIAISLKLGCKGAELWASDLSPEAIALSRDNAALHGCELRIVEGDLFEPLQGQRFHLICCNPPYIPSDELLSPQPELSFEPRLALDGGADGLKFYKRILRDAPRHLLPGGWLLLEMGDGQAEALKALALVDFDTMTLYDDYAGLPRVLAARRKDGHGFAGRTV